MKLYATVTSERASKGQGGKNLNIIVRNEKGYPCIALAVVTDKAGRVQGNLYTDIIHASVKSQGTFLQDKGEKQKDEVHNHQWQYIPPNRRRCTTCRLFLQG